VIRITGDDPISGMVIALCILTAANFPTICCYVITVFKRAILPQQLPKYTKNIMKKFIVMAIMAIGSVYTPSFAQDNVPSKKQDKEQRKADKKERNLNDTKYKQDKKQDKLDKKDRKMHKKQRKVNKEQRSVDKQTGADQK
jgi:hypothetical protein